MRSGLVLVAALAAVLLAPGAKAVCTAGKNGCLKCDSTSGKCVECMHYWFDDDGGAGSDSYGLTSRGTCVKCQVPNDKDHLCRTCDGNKPTKCIECVDYELSNPVYVKRDGTCAYCQEGCDRCLSISGRCKKCNDGYYLRLDADKKAGRCVRCRDRNCADCSRSPAKCRACQPGTGKDKAGACVPCRKFVPNCGSCTTAYTCTNCDSGYGVKSGKCARCAVSHCEFCWANSAKCQECKDGFRLSGSRCIKA